MSYEASPATSSRGRRTKLTPARIKQIKELIASGVSCEDIAATVGVTVGTLKVSCSRLGISLRRPRPMNGNGGAVKQVLTKMTTSCPATFTVIVRCHSGKRATELLLTTAMIGRIASEASSTGPTISELAGELVATVAKRSLVQRVLDE